MSQPERWSLYKRPPGFVLGFHGCDRSVGEAVINGTERHLAASENDYDWLGHGVYFWESDPARALGFAEERQSGGRNSKGKIIEPFVLGAVIDLRFCLNLVESDGLAQVKTAYDSLQLALKSAEMPLPANRGKLRNLDCSVLNFFHEVRERGKLDPYDTVRGVFWEGQELYAGSGFRDQDHVQICVRNTDCILGYFRPIAFE